MSILGTCPECLHYADGMCNLRPRICFNYDHFERLPTVTLSRDVFETQYISRATFDAEVARLTALSTMKDDALDSYAEFYGRAAGMCGLPDDALPGAQTDAIILQRLAEHDEIARLTAALAAANEDAERLADKLSEVVAYGGYYADIENRMPPDGQTFKVIAVSLGGVDDFTVLRMDGKLYFASDPPREVPRGFEIIRIKPWDVKTFGKTEEEDF